MDAAPCVLIVEDDAALRNMLALSLPTWDVRMAATVEEARGQLVPLPDAVLTDVHLGSGNGIEFAAELAKAHPRLPVLVMTAFGDLALAVKALRAGAYDFLTKPLDLNVLHTALERAREAHALRQEVRQLRRQVRLAEGLHDLVGQSAPMRRVFDLVTRIAAAPSTVLVRGESGTGKELVANAIHASSPRKDRPFVAVNCAAVPENLIESELFGHRKGAFTDAHAARVGLFVQADKGTIFLDEVGDLPLPLQAKLLRVLQERRVRPVGADHDVAVDVRVIAATHRDLEALVEAGGFRDDLRYRLDVITLDLPPLRERGRDVLILAQRFIQHFAAQFGKPIDGLSPEAARQLLAYPWPGNVRELQNSMERAVLLSEHPDIQRHDLPPRIADAEPSTTVLAVIDDPVTMLPLAEIEKRYILQVLEAVGGRKAEAARILEVDRKTLYRKLERWGSSGAD